MNKKENFRYFKCLRCNHSFADIDDVLKEFKCPKCNSSDLYEYFSVDENLLKEFEFPQNKKKTYVIEDINEKYKLKAGFNNKKEWFLQLLNNKKIIWESTSKKFILDVKSVKNELENIFCDLDIVKKKKEARRLVNQKFVILRPNLHEIKRSVISVISVNSVITYGKKNSIYTLIFSSDAITKQLHPSVGKINDHYYFGVMIPKKVPLVTESGDVIGEKQEPQLVFVFDDHTHKIVDDEFQRDNNVQVNGELIMEKQRWDLENIKSFIEHTGVLIDHYKVIDAKELFNRIKELYKKYIYFDEEGFYDVLPLWDIGTYFFTLFDAYPYVDLWGLKRSGKTKVMTVSSLISFNAVKFVNMSEAALFRIVDQNKPTLYIDEAENLWKQDKGEDDTTDIVALLNAGWMKGDKVPRIEKTEGKQTAKYFDPYCPKMLGSIKGLKGALHDRCIKVVMVRTKKEDRRGDMWPSERDEEFAKIRNALYPFALKRWKEVDYYYQHLEKEFNISDRDWQIWKPILVIAYIIDEELYKKIGKFAEEQTEAYITESIDEESWDMKIYDALLENVTDEEKKYPMSEIKSWVHAKFDEKEKKPSSKWIGRHMNKIGFKKYKRREGKGVLYFLSKKIVYNVLEPLLQITLNAQNTQTTQDQKTPDDVKFLGLKAYKGNLDSSKDTSENINNNLYVEEEDVVSSEPSFPVENPENNY